MPIDTSIYGMLQQPKPIPGPLDQYAQGLQVSNMLDQQDTGRLQRQQLQQQIAMQPEMQRRAAEKDSLERGKLTAETKHKEAETLLKNSEILRNQLATVRDQPTYDAWREMSARLMGPDIASKAPAQFSPELQAQMLRKADDFNEKIKLVMTDLGGTVQPTNPHTGQPVGPAIPKTAAPQPPQGATWDSERGVYVQPPARGSLQPGAVAPAPAGLPPRVGDVATLRKEFNDLPEVKNYRSVVPIINSAFKAPDTRAGDIQFAYTIGKIFDPNSVVREGELKLVGEAATVMQKYLGELRTLTEGKGRLTPQTRQELIDTAMARVSELEGAQLAARKTYETQAKAKGLPLDQIFIDMPKVQRPKKDAAAPAGKPERIAGDDGYNALPSGALFIGPDGKTRRKP